ncbi:CapA family protein, partial [Streptomyces eurythermus]
MYRVVDPRVPGPQTHPAAQRHEPAASPPAPIRPGAHRARHPGRRPWTPPSGSRAPGAGARDRGRPTARAAPAPADSHRPLETPLAPAEGPFTGFPRFAAPPQIATALSDVGFHSCSTASNHVLDQGEAGVRRTLDALDAAGLRHSGSARNREEADRPNIIEVKGVPVAHLSYSYGFGGRLRPADKP